MPTQRRSGEPSVSGAAQSGGTKSKRAFIRDIKSEDDDVRAAACQSAGRFGASVVRPLAKLTEAKEPEVARAARRALWHIVRHCGRPGAEDERRAVNKALVGVLSEKSHTQFAREVLWMLSEIGDDRCVAPIAAPTADPDVREDACMALERIPGGASLDALRAAFDAAPGAFKPCVAESLRRRGVTVTGVASAKLTPIKSTNVKPL